MDSIIISSLLESAEQIHASLKRYEDGFKNVHLINFSAAENERKKALRRYNLYSAELAEQLRECDTHAARLSECILIADKQCNSERCERLYHIFEGYESLLSAINLFVKQSETVFVSSHNNEASFRPSALMQAARALSATLDVFEKTLKQSK